MKQTKQWLVGTALMASLAAANAAVDVSDIADALVDIAAVGTAVFGVYIAIKLVKWVRRSL